MINLYCPFCNSILDDINLHVNKLLCHCINHVTPVFFIFDKPQSQLSKLNYSIDNITLVARPNRTVISVSHKNQLNNMNDELGPIISISYDQLIFPSLLLVSPENIKIKLPILTFFQ